MPDQSRPMRLRPLLAVFCIGVLLAVGPVGAGAQAAPFEIDAIVSLTGPGAFLGKNTALALNVVETQVNRAGGISGRSIKFDVQDDGSSPQTAVQLLDNILPKHPPVVIGTNLVAGCSAMGALTKSGPVVYCLSGGMHPDRGGYMFAFGADTVIYARATIQYFRERGWKRIAIMATTDASGKDGERVTDLALALPQNKDMVVVDREQYASDEVSVAAQIAKIKAAAPQAFFLWGTGTPIGTAFNTMKQAGLNVPTAVSSSNLIYAEMKQFSAFLPTELYFAGPPCASAPGGLPRGAIRDAVSRYADGFQAVAVRADVSQAVGYDPAWIVVGALKKLGLGATAPQIRDYIAGLHDWYGAAGRYDFRDGSQKGISDSSTLIVRYDQASDRFVAASKLGGLPL